MSSHRNTLSVHMGVDGVPCIHVYRVGFSHSVSLYLHDDGNITASKSSLKYWREWAEDMERWADEDKEAEMKAK